MVYRMQLTYDEIVDILNVNFIAGSANGYTLTLGIYEISDINLMIKFLLNDEVKVKTNTDDIGLRSDLTTKKTVRFTQKFFFYTILGFIQSQSEPLGIIEGFVKIIPGSYKSDQSINITGIDKH